MDFYKDAKVDDPRVKFNEKENLVLERILEGGFQELGDVRKLLVNITKFNLGKGER
jgi:hypothetical protein